VRRSFVRSMSGHEWHDSEMPLRGYFLSVGGALLMLLFAADWLMSQPAPNGSINSHSELPAIRIHSELKGPDAVVIVTNQPAILPILAKHQGAAAPQSLPSPESHVDNTYEEAIPPVLEKVDADNGRPAMSVEPVPNVRDRFAQLAPGSLRHDDPSESKGVEFTPRPKRKRARARTEKPLSLAEHSRFDPALEWCHSSQRGRDVC